MQLVSFTATRAASSGVALAWATASELNSARFEVERSTNGVEFERVATVAAQGSSAKAHSYAAVDEQAPGNMLYYRLRSVDEDGTAAYSPTVPVAAATLLEAYPNPTADLLNIPGAAGRVTALRDLLGRVVRTGPISAAGQLSLAGLAPGTYLLTVDGAPTRRISKVE
ncbi:MAG: T9SS type A sorting domain-containing protein [Hymenobacter sp.]|nr:MAG: T9SS type A sorting domain-containing protein [Hymenobacter sp.]